MATMDEVYAERKAMAEARGGPEMLARRRAAYARLSEVTIREAGHMMHQDQPEAFAAAVESFIAAAGSPP